MLCCLRHFVTLAHHGLLSFLKKFFGFHLCLQLDREKSDHRTEAEFESLVLGPLGAVGCPGSPLGEHFRACLLCLLLV